MTYTMMKAEPETFIYHFTDKNSGEQNEVTLLNDKTDFSLGYLNWTIIEVYFLKPSVSYHFANI